MTTHQTDRFSVLPDDQTLAATVTGLEQRGFGVQLVDGLDEARVAVLNEIPDGCSVMTNPSVTLEETGLVEAIDGGTTYASMRTQLQTLDRATQLREIKLGMGLPDVALGSVHAVTRDGTLVVASALGSQLVAYTWGAAKVIFVVGAQKLVPDLAAARQRVFEHCLPLEDARALGAYGVHSRVGKLLEIHQEDPGRIHVVLIRRRVGF
jgi:hypothetical protein